MRSAQILISISVASYIQHNLNSLAYSNDEYLPGYLLKNLWYFDCGSVIAKLRIWLPQTNTVKGNSQLPGD